MSAAPPPESEELPPSLERLVFFSDAVFAIAMTLLVIDLTVPAMLTPDDNGELINQLHKLVPNVFAYALSFGVVGMYWLAHWRRFRSIVRANEMLALINLVLLGFVALIPFPTAVIGAHGDKAAALVLYVVVLSAGGVIGGLSWLYAYRAGLCRADVGPREVKLGLLSSLSGPIVMVASLPLMLVNLTLTEASWVLIFPLQILLRRL